MFNKTESPKKLLTARSGRESPLKSPTITAEGRSPTGTSFLKNAACPTRGWHAKDTTIEIKTLRILTSTARSPALQTGEAPTVLYGKKAGQRKCIMLNRAATRTR